uniref:Uncharacterized protein n=1 Tax=Nelumbo nucifera TaxID=4432 RepID=A0A822ZKL3_NELNU|nr:TPA_asm: hypothetical protein HUJ06_001776 [Nelumbo nucifera]
MNGENGRESEERGKETREDVGCSN